MPTPSPMSALISSRTAVTFPGGDERSLQQLVVGVSDFALTSNRTLRLRCEMSAFGPKQTFPFASHMSAFGGKADMTLCGIPLLRSLLGVKRTCSTALHMSAFDPKRTSQLCAPGATRYSYYGRSPRIGMQTIMNANTRTGMISIGLTT